MTMLITGVKPSELWGKKVYDSEGHFLGRVVVIASRRGVVRKVVVQRATSDQPMGFTPHADTRVDSEIVLPAAARSIGRPLLRLVR
jgi:sporulation protein YlmC with PRC-barrel domain